MLSFSGTASCDVVKCFSFDIFIILLSSLRNNVAVGQFLPSFPADARWLASDAGTASLTVKTTDIASASAYHDMLRSALASAA